MFGLLPGDLNITQMCLYGMYPF